jgi:EAL domain-containing protein (putative c-di-GMP-specific phosphodiesterase class I)
VIRAACRQLRKWIDRGFRVPVAINISGKELLHGDPARVVEAEAAAAGVPTALIEVEITESLLVKDSVTVQSALKRLRALGCRIALDDFGTGYSSLYHLRNFKIDKIKIDRSFVENMSTERESAEIVSALIGLGHGLGLTVIAEGIEADVQDVELLAKGCEQGQGFLFGKAVSAEQTKDFFVLPGAGNVALVG